MPVKSKRTDRERDDTEKGEQLTDRRSFWKRRVIHRAFTLAQTVLMIIVALQRITSANDNLSFGGEIRERYEFRDNADFNRNRNDTLSFIGSRIRLYAASDVTPDMNVFFQMQDSRLFGSEASTASNEKNLDLHQGFLVIRNIAGPLTLTLGRQELVFGDQRLVGNFDWSNVGRSFDALRLT